MISTGLRSIIIPTRKHPLPIDLDKTALLIIDMQNDFCHPEGFSGSELGFNESDHQAAIKVVLAEDGVIGWSTCSTEFLQALNSIEPC